MVVYTQNMIADSSIPGKNTSFLFESFFSQVYNKRFSIYGSMIPLRDRMIKNSNI